MVHKAVRSYAFKVWGITDLPPSCGAERAVIKFKGQEYVTPIGKKDDSLPNTLLWNTVFMINLAAEVETMMSSFAKNEIRVKVQDAGSKTIATGAMVITKVADGRNKDLTMFIELKNLKGDSFGQLGVGWFRTITRSPTEHKAARKKKWFEKKVEKESRKLEKKIDRMIDFMFGGDNLKKLKSVVQGASGAEAEAKVLYELMRFVKTQEGRELLAYKLDPERLPARTVKRHGSSIIIHSKKTFEFLSVLVKAAIREGTYTRDFQLNKGIYDIAGFYSFVDKKTKECKCLFGSISNESTYSAVESMEFWESTFVAMERVINPLKKDDHGNIQPHDVDEKKQRKASDMTYKKERILDMLSVFLHQMVFFSSVEASIALNFAERMCLIFDIPESNLDAIQEGIKTKLKFRKKFEPEETTPTKKSKDSKKHTPRKRRNNHSIMDVHIKLDGILQHSPWVRYRNENGVFFHNKETNQISDFPPPNSIFEDGQVQRHTPKTVSREYLFGEVRLGYVSECWMQTKVGQTTTWEQEEARFRSVRGNLVVTNFRVEFTPFDGERGMCETLPVHAMDRFEHDIFTVTTAVGLQQDMQVMVFHTKDFRTLRVTANYSEERGKMLKQIKKLAFPKHDTGLFAFTFRQPVAHADDGWELYSVEREMRRQGALRAGWKISDINRNFNFSPTYPQRLCLPEDISEANLINIAKFRSKRRLPALTYYFARKKVALLRSSQPMVGLTGKRGEEEESMFQDLNITAIFDARPTENAFANKAKGGGYEDPRFYSAKGGTKCEIYFCDIHNIHRMRASLQHLLLACEAQVSRRSDDFWDVTMKSKWLSHVRNLVLQSYRLVLTLISGRSCLVHCSDGWDRTAQMVSLAQICLDPYYRTIDGLAVLIEKDWCSFGHKFHKRIGHGSSKFSDSERSPIFIQFLDALWQLWRQSPERFEYNERLLEYLADEVVACRFGTFLFDTEKRRYEAMISQNTVSIWTHVCKTKRSEFVNPLYLPNFDKPSAVNMMSRLAHNGKHQTPSSLALIASDSQYEGILKINTDPRLFRVWPYYYRQDTRLIQSEHDAGWIGENIFRMYESKSKLQIDWLRKRVGQLEHKLRESERMQKEMSNKALERGGGAIRHHSNLHHRRHSDEEEEEEEDEGRRTATPKLHPQPQRFVHLTGSMESWAREKSGVSAKSVKSTKSVRSLSSFTPPPPPPPPPRFPHMSSFASSTQGHHDVMNDATSTNSPNNDTTGASSVQTGMAATQSNSQMNVGSSLATSTHWIPIRRPLSTGGGGGAHHHQQHIPKPGTSSSTLDAPQNPWEEKQSVHSAMAIAHTVRTAKTFGSEMGDDDDGGHSPRSTSPNPSTALPSHRSHSPTEEINSVTAVGDKHDENSYNQWGDLAPPHHQHHHHHREGKLSSSRTRTRGGSQSKRPPAPPARIAADEIGKEPLGASSIRVERGDGSVSSVPLTTSPTPTGRSGGGGGAIAFSSATSVDSVHEATTTTTLSHGLAGRLHNYAVTGKYGGGGGVSSMLSMDSIATAPLPPLDDTEISPESPQGLDQLIEEDEDVTNAPQLNDGEEKGQEEEAAEHEGLIGLNYVRHTRDLLLEDDKGAGEGGGRGEEDEADDGGGNSLRGGSSGKSDVAAAATHENRDDDDEEEGNDEENVNSGAAADDSKGDVVAGDDDDGGEEEGGGRGQGHDNNGSSSSISGNGKLSKLTTTTTTTTTPAAAAVAPPDQPMQEEEEQEAEAEAEEEGKEEEEEEEQPRRRKYTTECPPPPPEESSGDDESERNSNDEGEANDEERKQKQLGDNNDDDDDDDDDEEEEEEEHSMSRRGRSTSMIRRGTEASAFDWGATIKPSMLGSKKDFFVSVRRSTVGSHTQKIVKQIQRSLHMISDIKEIDDEQEYDPRASALMRGITPPPPPDSDEEDSDDTS